MGRELLHHDQGEPLEARASVPAFSALVAAWNEAASIDRHIESFKALGWQHTQLIICAGGEDETYAIATSHAADNVIVIEQRDGMGKQGALRACLELATHDYVFLTDADCLFEHNALRALFQPLILGGYQVATGGAIALEEQEHRPLIQYQMCRNRFFHDGNGAEVDGILGRNALLTRASVRAAGAFEADVRTGTDYHMSMQLVAAGIRIAHVKDSCVRTRFPETPADYVHRSRRWIKNLLIHDPDRHRRHTAVSTLIAISVLLVPAGIVVLPWPLAAASGLVWAAALWPRYRDLRYGARVGERVTTAAFVWTPAIMLLDQVAVLGALRDVLSPVRRERW